ncbi:hypothetical protein QUA26_14370 [Microcoleus sp. Pol12A4]|uniref:hypothetical protein n=1 Tax=unclassified Microcoleus TaxID=2642155 RepID=UPI002FCFA225
MQAQGEKPGFRCWCSGRDLKREAAANSKTIIGRSPPQSRDLPKKDPETGFLPHTSRFASRKLRKKPGFCVSQ